MGKGQSKTQTSLKDVIEIVRRVDTSELFRNIDRILLQERDSLTIALVGKTGVGKSQLVNALVGDFKADEGNSLHPETKRVEVFQSEKHGVQIKIWDTPGVQDGTGQEDDYLQQIHENVKDVDLLLYCVAMTDTRFRPEDKAAIRNIVDKLGTEIWKKAMIVLTFANQVRPNSSYGGSAKKYFEETLAQFRKAYTEESTSVGVQLDNPCTPAGDIGQQELPICKDWLPVFWLMALKKIDNSAKSAMLKVNYSRLKFPSLKREGTENEDRSGKDGITSPQRAFRLFPITVLEWVVYFPF